MNVLVAGSGAREHALAHRLRESARVDTVTVVPGNPGMERIRGCECRGEDLSLESVLGASRERQPDFVVIGPAELMREGLTDALRDEGFYVVGSPRAIASIGVSKTAAKEAMIAAGISTPDYRSCTDPESAMSAVEEFDTPVVVKADGLAAGTGVTVCHSRESAEIAIDGALRQRRFGSAGERVVIERFVPGEVACVTVLIDESGYLMLPGARDYTQVGEGGTGPNTLGMGAIVPNPSLDTECISRIEEEIVQPSVHAVWAMCRENDVVYRGAVHLVLLLGETGPSLLGYKVRFGDPETQALMALIEGDLGVLLHGLSRGQLLPAIRESGYGIRSGAVCAVVAAVSGYPGRFSSGQSITDDAPTASAGIVYYGAVRSDEHRRGARRSARPAAEGSQGAPADRFERLVVSGGRVLTVVSAGAAMDEARRNAYARLLAIRFEGMMYRRDIGGEPIIAQVIEEAALFLPQFAKRGGLLPVVVQDVDSGDVLMVAYANGDALRATRETGLATFWSTSREKLWTKGETSGDTLTVLEIRVDCDQDALLYRVEVTGDGVCHTTDAAGAHRRRCFYRTLQSEGGLAFDP